MQTNEEMKKRIMRRVYGVYVLRQLTQPVARILMLGVAVFAIAGSVSVSNVLQNASHKGGMFEFFNFAFSAFVNTRSIVQIAILIAGFVLVSITIDLARSFKQPSFA